MKKGIRKTLYRILACITAIALIAVPVEPAKADAAPESERVTVDYLKPVYAEGNTPQFDSDGNVVFESASTQGILLTAASTAWDNDTYVASGSSIVLSGKVIVQGNVKLILCDGCMLAAHYGIEVTAGNSLTIYSQSDEESQGSLTATTSNGSPAIGSEFSEMGTVTINGGECYLKGDSNCAAIGGGYGNTGKNIYINGGMITTIPGAGAACIGGGSGGDGTDIVINGGKIEFYFGPYDLSPASCLGACIGGGNHGNGERITINGGTLLSYDTRSNPSSGGAFIGGGKGGNGSYITITGGTIVNVDALEPKTNKGGYGAAGIGGGGVDGTLTGDGSYITITGGTIAVTGGYGAAGIGGGLGGNGSYITITGGEVKAYAGDEISNTNDCGAGIGGGKEGNGSNIIISGGTVTARGGDGGAGIGGGYSGDGSAINITGGEVTAQSKALGAGIGGGRYGNGSDINISGGIVTAKGGEYGGAGIGGGVRKAATNITISGGTVTAESSIVDGAGGSGIGSGAISGGNSASCYAKNITISGGTVTANALECYSAAIGGGVSAGADGIYITGGTVTAIATIPDGGGTLGSDGGAAIGGGDSNYGINIVISGGRVVATSDGVEAIGSGAASSGSKTIGDVTATASTVEIRNRNVAVGSRDYDEWQLAVLPMNDNNHDAIASKSKVITTSTPTVKYEAETGTRSFISGIVDTKKMGCIEARIALGSDSNVCPDTAFEVSNDNGVTYSPASNYGLSFEVVKLTSADPDNNLKENRNLQVNVTTSASTPAGYYKARMITSLGTDSVTTDLGKLIVNETSATVEYLKVLFDESGNVKYSDDEPGYEKAVVPMPAAAVTEFTEEWGIEGRTTWYYVTSPGADIAKRVKVVGDVHLILSDGTMLETSKGINVEEGSSLSIYEQIQGTGLMSNIISGALTSEGNATVGSDNGNNAGTINIYGGYIINQNSGNGAAAIGGGAGAANGGNINVYGGLMLVGSGSGAYSFSNGTSAQNIHIDRNMVVKYGTTPASLTVADSDYDTTVATNTLVVLYEKPSILLDPQNMSVFTEGVGEDRVLANVFAHEYLGDFQITSSPAPAHPYELEASVVNSTKTAAAENITVTLGSESGWRSLTVHTNANTKAGTYYVKVTSSGSYVYDNRSLYIPVNIQTPSFEYVTAAGTSETLPAGTAYIIRSGEQLSSLTSGSWYAVNSDVTLTGDLSISGLVSLIICDGKTLTINGAVNVAEGGNLKVYGQTGATGRLIVNGEEITSDGNGITFVKKSQTVSAATKASSTKTAITVNAYTGGVGAVSYAISTSSTKPAADSQTWQSGTEFTGLTAGRTYYVFIKLAGNSFVQSVISEAASMATEAEPYVPNPNWYPIPTMAPTTAPTEAPTAAPTAAPTQAPSATGKPGATPAPEPTEAPSESGQSTPTPAVTPAITPDPATQKKIEKLTRRDHNLDTEAFMSDKKLSAAVLPSYVESIGRRAFKYCTGLKEIQIGEGVTLIGKSAFYGCTSLKGVTLPEGLLKIEGYAFKNCTSFKELTIPKNVTFLGEAFISGCKNLKSLTITSEKLTADMLQDGVFRGASKKLVIYVPADKVDEYRALFLSKGMNKSIKVKAIK